MRPASQSPFTLINPFSSAQTAFGGVVRELIVPSSIPTSADYSIKQLIQEGHFENLLKLTELLEKLTFNYCCKITGKIGDYPHN